MVKYSTLPHFELIQRFGNAVASHEASIFIGAGTSIPSGYPGWTDLMSFAQAELGLGASFEDLALLAQYYIANVAGGRDRLEDEILRALLAVTPIPNPTYHLLAEIPVQDYWTTNYDTLLESSVQTPLVLSEDENLLNFGLRGQRRIYKMHGSLMSHGHSSPRGAPRFIVAREDFENYPLTHPRMWAQLVATFLTKSMLFLGFSFTDPNILHLFRLVRQQVGIRNREHFTVMRRPSTSDEIKLFELRSRDLSDLGVRVCEVSSFSEIDEIIKQLVRRTRDPKIFVAGSLDSTPPNTSQLLELIGSHLATTDASVVTSGPLGRILCYSFASTLVAKRRYEPDRIHLYYQSSLGAARDIEMRLGVVRFYGNSRTDMRERGLSNVRALLIAGGGSGTAEEVAIAKRLGIPIVPLATTGGIAAIEWASMQTNLTAYTYGGQAISPGDFELLNHPSVNIAAQQAFEFLKKAVYL